MPSWLAWERGIKRLLLIWHRRAGKDEIALHMAAIAAHQRPANYWHCLPQFSSARRAIWEAVNPHSGQKRIDEAFPKELRKTTREDTMTIEFKSGSVWRVVGSDNPDSLVGAPPAGIVFSEWALSNPSAWGYLAPILEENGGWAAFITTPRGRNHVAKMLEMAKRSTEWFAEILTPRETGYPQARIEVQRQEYHSVFGLDAGNALIEQEYWCSFEAAILGAYWGRELVTAEQEGRIAADVDLHEDAPVQTAWDLGVDDAMAIWWFQAIAGQIRIVDYHEGHGYAIPHYANLIIGRAKARGYRRGTDWVPHDAKVREMTSSGKDGKAKQRIEVMIESGLKPRLIADHKIMDGISAVRQVLHRCWFDADRCAQGLEALRQYQTEWDEDKRVFKPTPLHNWASHGADAMRTMAMAYRELAPNAIKPLPKVLTVGGEYGPNIPSGMQGVTLNDLWDMKKRPSKRI